MLEGDPGDSVSGRFLWRSKALFSTRDSFRGLQIWVADKLLTFQAVLVQVKRTVRRPVYRVHVVVCIKDKIN